MACVEVKPQCADREETSAEGYGASSTCKLQFWDGIALLRCILSITAPQIPERLSETMSLREFTVSRSKCHVPDKWVYSSSQEGDLLC